MKVAAMKRILPILLLALSGCATMTPAQRHALYAEEQNCPFMFSCYHQTYAQGFENEKITGDSIHQTIGN